MFVVIGIGFAWGATNYKFGSSARPGPGFFPLGLGFLMAILGAVVLFKALVVETEDGEPVGAWAFRPLLIVMGSVGLFGYTLPLLGMAVALPILVLMCSLAGDEFHWKDAIVSVVVLTLGSWLIFIKGLNLVIPVWPKFITG
jgi:hypothetical protein